MNDVWVKMAEFLGRLNGESVSRESYVRTPEYEEALEVWKEKEQEWENFLETLSAEQKEKLEEIIRRLKSRQMHDCIVVEEKISKDALKKYGEDTVNAVGATWKQSDVFGYEVNIAKLEQIKAGG